MWTVVINVCQTDQCTTAPTVVTHITSALVLVRDKWSTRVNVHMNPPWKLPTMSIIYSTSLSLRKICCRNPKVNYDEEIWNKQHCRTEELQNCRELNCIRIVALYLTCLPILSFMISWVWLRNIITWLNERRWVVWSQSFWNELRWLAQDIRSIVGTNTTQQCNPEATSIFINFWDWCCTMAVLHALKQGAFI